MIDVLTRAEHYGQLTRQVRDARFWQTALEAEAGLEDFEGPAAFFNLVGTKQEALLAAERVGDGCCAPSLDNAVYSPARDADRRVTKSRHRTILQDGYC